MNHGEPSRIPEWLERLEGGMKPKEPIQINGRVGIANGRPLDGDRAPGVVVSPFAVRNDHTQAVHGPSLEDGDKDSGPTPGLPGVRGSH